MKIEEIVKATKGQLLSGNENDEVTGITQDTRHVNPGYLYIPLMGKRDGHDFIPQAFEKGAIASLTNHPIEDMHHNLILVQDTHQAMGDIARYMREKSQALVVGVTGSVGKTSTKDMIASVVAQSYTTLKTQGNFNNDIGVPLTIFNYQHEEAMVIEMGMNHLGEIDYLTHIAMPDVAVITNVGTAHIGEVGSRENILKAKMEITHGLKKGGRLIVNGDNDMLARVNSTNDYEVYKVGIDGDVDLKAYDIALNEAGSVFKTDINGQDETFVVNEPGKHFIYNALSAIAVGLSLNIPVEKIKRGIATFELTKNRADMFTLKGGIKVFDGTYNANLDSMKASIDVLAQYQGRKIAVLADMLELGDYEEKLHREVGQYCCDKHLDVVLTVGKAANYISDVCKTNGIDTKHFEDNNALVQYLLPNLQEGDVILVKGSNGMKLKEVISALKEKEA